MLKVLLVIVFSLSSLHAAVPLSESIGRIQTNVDPQSITATALNAAGEEYTEAWLDEYTADPMKAGEILAPVLSSVLPLSNPIAGKEKAGAVDILDTATGAVYSFIFRDGKIASCYPSYSAASPEL